MKKQIILFLKYLLLIEDGTNKDMPNSKIEEIIFSPDFHKAFIKAQYIKKDDTTFRGYPFTIDYEEGADYWGMMLDSKGNDKNKIIKKGCIKFDKSKM